MNIQALKEAAGQALIVGFQGTQAPPETLRAALSAGEVGGVILFSRNIEPEDTDYETLRGLLSAIQSAAPVDGPAPFISVDQEGGRVRRLRRVVTEVPPAGELAAQMTADQIASLSEALATDLADLGFNLNFAPVLDVFTNPANTVIGDRAFGSDPARVVKLAGAWAVGHTIAGVVPCGKHFPGHGDTVADSHFELPTVRHDLASLRQRELLPFRRAARAGVPMLMTAHLHVPAIDAEHPMTLSRAALTDLLRDELGFKGVVITDDLEMKAVSERYSIEEMVTLGLEAGVDIFLICHTEELWQRAHAQLVKLAERAPVLRDRLMASADRVRELKHSYRL